MKENEKSWDERVEKASEYFQDCLDCTCDDPDSDCWYHWSEQQQGSYSFEKGVAWTLANLNHLPKEKLLEIDAVRELVDKAIKACEPIPDGFGDFVADEFIEEATLELIEALKGFE